MTPFFSIMIPVYNVKDYIEHCMTTVLNQTFNDYEIILIDDGSTDGSGKMCDKYYEANKDKVTVIHKQNGGLLAARRTGIEVAKGKYGVFVDSDDYISEKLLETVYAKINKNDDVDMVIYNFARYFEKTKETVGNSAVFENERVFAEDKQEIYSKLIYTYELNNLVMKVINMELIKSDPTDYSQYYSNSFGEDLLQSLYAVTYAKKIVYIDDVLYYYRINEKSMTATVNYNVLDKQNDTYIIDVLLKYMKLWNMDTMVNRKRMFAKKYRHFVISFWNYYKAMATNAEKKELTGKFRVYLNSLSDKKYLSNRFISYYVKLTVILIKFRCLWAIKILSFIINC